MFPESLFQLRLTKEKLLRKLIHKLESHKKVPQWHITDCMKALNTIDKILLDEGVFDEFTDWKKNRFLEKAA